MAQLHPTAEALEGWMRDIRHAIHRHPELAFQERRTADLIGEKLADIGLDFTTGIGGTGIVASLTKGSGERAIALRADMDALPMQEQTGVPHQSQVPGVFHGCGHDGHSAMLLGAAQALALTGEFDGTVHFIFQPAEEGEGGAKAMIADGLFERFAIDEVYALHNWPQARLGVFGSRPGPLMAAFSKFDIALSGSGGHAALPHRATDQILAASALVQALQAIVARRFDPIASAVVSITQFHAGAAYNVLPAEAVLAGCTRYFSDEAGALIRREIDRAAQGIAAIYGCTAQVAFEEVFTSLINDAAAVDHCAKAVGRLGPAASWNADFQPVMASDDFAFMLREKPGCYVFMGTGHEGGSADLHNPHYDFNDTALSLGASYWVRLVESRLSAFSDPGFW